MRLRSQVGHGEVKTYAKRKAARPAKAATITEDWMLEPPLMKLDGVEVAEVVTLLATEELATTTLALGVEYGVTVMVE